MQLSGTCGRSVADHTRSSSFLHDDVSTASLCPVSRLTHESNLRMPVLQNGFDGPCLPAFTDAFS